MKQTGIWGGALLAGLFLGGMCADMPPANAAMQSALRQGDAVVSYETLAGMVWSGKDEEISRSMTLHADGSFEGTYVYGDGHALARKAAPGCGQIKFRGQLGRMEKVNAYAYMLPLLKAEYLDGDRPASGKDGIKYAHGQRADFADTKRLYLYLPGTPAEYLPAFLRESRQGRPLERYVLLNPVMQSVWVSAPVREEQRILLHDRMTRAGLQREIAFCESEQQELQKAVDSAYASQMLRNLSAFRIYDMWEIEMTRLCRALEKEMSAEEFAAFSEKQAKWRQNRENAMEKEGRKWQGGTGEGAARASAGITVTRKRVYELYNLLSET